MIKQRKFFTLIFFAFGLQSFISSSCALASQNQHYQTRLTNSLTSELLTISNKFRDAKHDSLSIVHRKLVTNTIKLLIPVAGWLSLALDDGMEKTYHRKKEKEYRKKQYSAQIALEILLEIKEIRQWLLIEGATNIPVSENLNRFLTGVIDSSLPAHMEGDMNEIDLHLISIMGEYDIDRPGVLKDLFSNWSIDADIDYYDLLQRGMRKELRHSGERTNGIQASDTLSVNILAHAAVNQRACIVPPPPPPPSPAPVSERTDSQRTESQRGRISYPALPAFHHHALSSNHSSGAFQPAPAYAYLPLPLQGHPKP